MDDVLADKVEDRLVGFGVDGSRGVDAGWELGHGVGGRVVSKVEVVKVERLRA